MAAINSAETLKRWLTAIDAHDVSALTALMAADHVDSLGNRANRGTFGFAETNCPYWLA